MSDKQETIEILVIKQDEKPIRKTIPNTLEAKQHEVGGYIEPFGLKNGATIYCNEEGKLGRWTLNRAIRAYDLEDVSDSQIVEMMAGTFFISGFDPESGEEVAGFGGTFHLPVRRLVFGREDAVLSDNLSGSAVRALNPSQ